MLAVIITLASALGDLAGKAVGAAGKAVSGAAKDAVGAVSGGVLGQLGDAVNQAVAGTVKSLGTFWVKLGAPNLTSTNGGSTPTDTVAFLQGSLYWYMAAAAVFSVIFAGGKMALEQRAQPARELLQSLVTLVVVSGAGLTAIALATNAADGFAKWIIDQSLNGKSFDANLTKLLGVGAATGIGLIVELFLGLAAVIASITQIALMIVRGAMLVILAGLLPLSAAATNTEWGRHWFKKNIGWLIAWILYFPVAATVYATALRLSGQDAFAGGDKLVSAITGLVLMVMALVALPALMRFVTPAVGAVTSGGGGGGAALAGMGMASGAKRMPRGGGAQGAQQQGGGKAGGGGGGQGGGQGGGEASGGGGGGGGASGAGMGVAKAGKAVSDKLQEEGSKATNASTGNNPDGSPPPTNNGQSPRGSQSAPSQSPKGGQGQGPKGSKSTPDQSGQGQSPKGSQATAKGARPGGGGASKGPQGKTPGSSGPGGSSNGGGGPSGAK